MFKVHVHCIAFINYNVAIYKDSIVLYRFQFQHLQKQQMFLAHSSIMNKYKFTFFFYLYNSK